MSKGKNRIIHFPADCIGCNSCVENAPGNWYIDESTGKAILRGGCNKGGTMISEISSAEVADNQRAAMSCPMGIIRVIDEKGQDISEG